MRSELLSERAGSKDEGRPGRNLVAAVVGAVFGAIAFALCTLWIGALAGVVIALVSTIWVLARGHVASAIAFVAAGTLCAIALEPSTTFALLGALAYAAGLALTVGRARSTELLA